MVRTVKLVGLLLVALVVALAAASDDAPTKLQFNVRLFPVIIFLKAFLNISM